MMNRRYWIVRFWKNGFEGVMLVYGTEDELWEYLNSEIGGAAPGHIGDYSYSGATGKEVEMARALKIKAYICPEVKK